MTKKKIIIPALVLGLVCLLSVSCLRKAGSEPGPFGPGTIHISLDLSANPNVLYVTDAGRMTSQIKATVKSGGVPFSGQTVVFSVEAGLGEFSDYTRRIAAVTNSQGQAFATYISPSNAELPGDSDVMIEAQLVTCSPYTVLRSVYLRLLKPRDW